ncbi:transposase domain-containing protein [Lasius niger]|uniref:Tpa: transposase domain-containing protein n=1 Tax=Lasius niger TaxID=67767 RepID=A0A0J7K1S7_LASNI|nr:transposase domain-containing protein [Lasius niger]
MEDDSQSENDISGNDNNVDWSTENTQDSMEDITDSESDEFDENVYLRMALTEWASHGVSKRKVNRLLSLLRKVHPELPKTYVTLLNTPKTTAVSEIDNGHVWYKGIKRNLDSFLTQKYLNTHGQIRLDISIDRLPLDSCGKLHFWPILGSLADKTCEPFIISVYFGTESKPSTLEQFLEEFIEEMEELSTNGFEFNGHVYDVSIHNFICDAPARSFVKCTIGHNGLFSCEKCEVEGEWYHNRIVYLNNGQKRTDQSFIDRRNPEHHQGLSPLEERLNVRMISQFRLV